MWKPDPQQIPGLLSKRPNFYARWLSHGLADYKFGSMRRTAFPGAEPFIGRWSSIEEDLSYIAKALPESDRQAFQYGCALALGALDWTQDRDEAIAFAIVGLSVRLRAFTVVPVLAYRAFRNFRRPMSDAMLARVFDAIQALANPGIPKLADCVGHIVRQLGSEFPASKVHVVLLAMIESKPAELVEHMRMLHGPLEAIYKDQEGDDKENAFRKRSRETLLLEIMERVPDSEVLLKSLDPGARYPDRIYRADVDDWWPETLVLSEEPAISEAMVRLSGLDTKRPGWWSSKQESSYHGDSVLATDDANYVKDALAGSCSVNPVDVR